METLFEDLVNEIVTDSKKNEVIPDTESASSLPNHQTNFAESNVEKKGHRRGVWKRIRVRPLDGFETAESQNYGQQYINHIPSVNAKEEKIKQFDLPLTTSAYEAVTSKFESETTTPSPTELESHTEVSVVSEVDPGTSSSTTTESESTSTTEVATDSPIEISTTVVPDDQNILTTTRSTDTKIEDTTKHVFDQNDAQATERVTESPYNYDDYDTERVFTEIQNREDDQEPQSSNIFSEVKQKLTDLFTINDNDYDYQENNLPLKMQQYTTIERNKSLLNQISDDEGNKKAAKQPLDVVTEATSSFHKNLMDSVIYATSTSTEVSHETEICYRGRCIKTEKKPKT